ncbi:MAG: hypothetical protein HOP08_08645 [Cyclobacteriaceae bacterium]|nr:hypothetical protein [Cyclobacteriaceae bacterium]
MRKILALILFGISITVLYAQPVPYRNVVPVNIEEIQYPNRMGNTTSSQPQKGTVKLKDGSSVSGKITFFKKKEVFERVKVNTGEDKKEILATDITSIMLDPKIYEGKYPNDFKKPEKNFQRGYIVLPTGAKVTGKVAQLRDFSDYDFFVYNIMFLPDGSEVASSFKGGRIAEFGQEINGTMQVWDGYVDGYLLRMTDGRYRLSRNPYSKTKNEFFTSLKNSVTDSLAKGAAQAALTKSIQDGQNLNESIENSVNAGSAVSEVLGQVEINKKEYLIFDTKNNTVVSVTKDAFPGYAQSLLQNCNASISKDLMTWDKAVEFFNALNAACK